MGTEILPELNTRTQGNGAQVMRAVHVTVQLPFWTKFHLLFGKDLHLLFQRTMTGPKVVDITVA